MRRKTDVGNTPRQQAGVSFVGIAIFRYLLFALMKALRYRRAPWYQCSLIREPFREISMIVLNDVEQRFLGELAMVLGK